MKLSIKQFISQQEQFEALTDLTLDENENSIELDEVYSLASCIGRCINLIVLSLDLSDQRGLDKICNKGAAQIGLGLSHCTQLSSLILNLKENSIDEIGTTRLSKGLGKCINLKQLYLNLSWNQIHSKGALVLGNEIAKCLCIENLNLDLSGQKIWKCVGAEGATGLGNGLGELKNLKTLDLNLGFNSIEEEGAANLGNSLGKCSNLITLNLNLERQISKLSDKGFLGLISGLQKCEGLLTFNLNLWESSITSKVMLDAGNELAKYSKLQTLSISLENSRDIGRQGASDFVNGLKNSPKLISLKIFFGCYNNVGITKKLEKELMKIKPLLKVHISGF